MDSVSSPSSALSSPTRKSTRVPIPNRRIGTPVQLTLALQENIMARGSKTHSVPDEEEAGTSNSSKPNRPTARKVSGVRKSPVKTKSTKVKATPVLDANDGSPTALIMEGESMPKDREDDLIRRKDADAGSDAELVDLTADDVEFPTVSELIAEGAKKELHPSEAVTVLPSKMVKGNKRKIPDSDSEVEIIPETPVRPRSTPKWQKKEAPTPAFVRKTVKKSPETDVDSAPEVVSGGESDQEGGGSDGGDVEGRVDSGEEEKSEVDSTDNEGEDSDTPRVLAKNNRYVPRYWPSSSIAQPGFMLGSVFSDDEGPEESDIPKKKERPSPSPEVSGPDPTLADELKDPGLEDTYANLPHLNHCVEMRPYGSFRGRETGQTMYGSFKAHFKCEARPPCLPSAKCPGPCSHIVDALKSIKNAITFQEKDNLVNLSRISPGVLHVLGTGEYIARENFSDPVICTSVMAVTESYLHKPVVRGKVMLKYISGVFLTVEWERFCTVVGMVYNQTDHIVGRLNGNAIQIGTNAIPTSTPSDNTTIDSSVAALCSPRKNKSVKSFASQGSTSQATPSKNLTADDHVPVYDARLVSIDRPVNWQKFIDKVGTILPSYNREIRPGSIALAGYTVNRWTPKSDGSALDPVVTLNLRWVVLLYSPPL
ncbi:hypothetical protein OE88DRAFT_1733263 [Heliocybe sulcata]|uniref:Uncharacterized protein n=1 Tax=Heliocybe sulcata TaxID=5364 RepID=A0A5C3NA47_9AGAM|nr:hypothetical protein OE88DRAFT_1733263 [Heliocybe sulcata]